MKKAFLRFLHQHHVYQDYYYCMKNISALKNGRVLANFFDYVLPYKYFDFMYSYNPYPSERTESDKKWHEIKLKWLMFLIQTQFNDFSQTDRNAIIYEIDLLFCSPQVFISIDSIKELLAIIRDVKELKEHNTLHKNVHYIYRKKEKELIMGNEDDE